MPDGRSWIAMLPAQLSRQGGALTRLLGFAESTPAVSSLSVGCSLGRSAADEYSDVDAAVGVECPRGAAGAGRVREVESALVDLFRDDLVDALREESLTDAFLTRRLFAQLRDGVQLDLAIIAEGEVRRGDAAPDFVPLHRSGSQNGKDVKDSPAATSVSAEQVTTWAFRGWRALLDVDKHLRRGSAWEAHHRLHEAREQVWALWAAARGATYPQHGLSQVLDLGLDPTDLPRGVDASVAGLGLDDLRTAALACADALDDASRQAAARCSATLPAGLAAWARRFLVPGSERP
ncbi:hypothetical protein AB0N29_06845 [Nocardioides sp. NPDC092400]|uniref:hypothetical protein n=1 Tax=Nocardioides sp. NPDC092400 TaxID=3155196 RepID=UPI00341A85F9